MKYSQKCKPHLLVLLVGTLAPGKINRAQKSIWIQNNYIFDSGLQVLSLVTCAIHSPWFPLSLLDRWLVIRRLLWTCNCALPCWKTQVKLGFETAGSWLTTSDQLPARHRLAGWPVQTSSLLGHLKLCFVIAGCWLTSYSDKIPAQAGWPAHTQLDQLYDQLGHAGWPVHSQLDQCMLRSSWHSWILECFKGHMGVPWDRLRENGWLDVPSRL